MKIRKEAVIGLATLVILAAGVTFFVNFWKSRTRNDMAEWIAGISGRGGGPPETIEGLRDAIARYERQIEAHVRDAGQIGVYWKILAVRLQDRGLHQEALEALEQAMKYNAEDPSLRYLTGISAARVAKGTVDMTAGERDRYYVLAESAFLTALGLDETYGRPRYALGVLYTFDLDRPEDAIPHLRRFLELAANDVDGMFVLARAYYMTSRYPEALDLYDRILRTTKDSDKKKEAQQNKQHVMEVYYE
jgi:tetratricopeptide (TPR) repeat protein